MKNITIQNKRQWLATFLVAGAALGSTMSGVQAQPAAGGGPGFGGGPGGGGPGGGFNGPPAPPDFRNLTQEQRQDISDKVRDFLRDQTMRMMLENAAITDKAVQDAVIDFANVQENATQVLREKNRELMRGANDQGTSNAQLGALLNGFRAGVEDETARRKTALAALDEKIKYSTQPRLAAVLTLLGLTGDEMAVTEGAVAGGGGRGGMTAIFGGGGPGGGGGFGGGPGGGGGFGGGGRGGGNGGGGNGGGPGFGGPPGGAGGNGGGPGFAPPPGAANGADNNQVGRNGRGRGGRGGNQ